MSDEIKPGCDVQRIRGGNVGRVLSINGDRAFVQWKRFRTYVKTSALKIVPKAAP